MRHYRKASLPNLTREVWCDNCELHPLLTTPDATHAHTQACTPLQESLDKPTKVPKFQTKFILWPVLTRWRVSPNNTGLRNALRQARWIHSENYWRAFPSLSDANPVRANYVSSSPDNILVSRLFCSPSAWFPVDIRQSTADLRTTI